MKTEEMTVASILEEAQLLYDMTQPEGLIPPAAYLRLLVAAKEMQVYYPDNTINVPLFDEDL